MDRKNWLNLIPVSPPRLLSFSSWTTSSTGLAASLFCVMLTKIKGREQKNQKLRLHKFKSSSHHNKRLKHPHLLLHLNKHLKCSQSRQTRASKSNSRKRRRSKTITRRQWWTDFFTSRRKTRRRRKRTSRWNRKLTKTYPPTHQIRRTKKTRLTPPKLPTSKTPLMQTPPPKHQIKRTKKTRLTPTKQTTPKMPQTPPPPTPPPPTQPVQTKPTKGQIRRTQKTRLTPQSLISLKTPLSYRTSQSPISLT